MSAATAQNTRLRRFCQTRSHTSRNCSNWISCPFRQIHTLRFILPASCFAPVLLVPRFSESAEVLQPTRQMLEEDRTSHSK